MIRFVDECVCCDLPCIDCGRKNVERVYCDVCDEMIGDVYYEVDGEDLCPDCVTSVLISRYLNTSSLRKDYYEYSLKCDDSFTEREIEDSVRRFESLNEENQFAELYQEDSEMIAEFAEVDIKKRNIGD